MAARSTDHPVRVTMGAVWTFQLDPPPPRPPRLSVAVTVGQTVLALTRVIFGVVYFNDCPQQPYIPNYLFALALLPLVTIPFVTLPCESDEAQLREHPRGCKACVMSVIVLFIYICTLAGNVWVFSGYQPNYDPTAADGLYCNKTLYTFAFWNAVLETFAIWVCLAKFCKGLLCGVILSPAPADRDYNRNV